MAAGLVLAVVGLGAYASPRLGGVAASSPAGPGLAQVAPALTPHRTLSPSASPSSMPSKPKQPKQVQPKQARPKPVTVPESGPGSYLKARTTAASATSSGRLYSFDVRVEKGLALDADQTARAIQKTLNDKRSWRGTGRYRFRQVQVGRPADLHVYLVTPGTTDRLCAPLRTRGEVSCQAGSKIVLNAKRWMRGAPTYGSDLASYRGYLVNHEFGHALGHAHLGCSRRGALAPVMLQQTKGLGGCRKNPWPMAAGGR